MSLFGGCLRPSQPERISDVAAPFVCFGGQGCLNTPCLGTAVRPCGLRSGAWRPERPLQQPGLGRLVDRGEHRPRTGISEMQELCWP